MAKKTHKHSWQPWQDAGDVFKIVECFMPGNEVLARMCSAPFCGAQQLCVSPGLVVEWDVSILISPSPDGKCVPCDRPSPTSPCGRCIQKTYERLGHDAAKHGRKTVTGGAR